MVTAALRAKVTNIVVIYAENRAFDGLYGNFPGAHGLSEVVDSQGKPTQDYIPQINRDGSVLPNLPPTWGGVTAAGVTPVVTPTLPGLTARDNALVANGAQPMGDLTSALELF